MFKLLWAAIAITSQGPVMHVIPETTKFESRDACEKFGKDMSPRMADWYRGALKAEWHVEIQTDFKCEPAGQPV